MATDATGLEVRRSDFVWVSGVVVPWLGIVTHAEYDGQLVSVLGEDGTVFTLAADLCVRVEDSEVPRSTRAELLRLFRVV